jgi:hypothetical protein
VGILLSGFFITCVTIDVAALAPANVASIAHVKNSLMLTLPFLWECNRRMIYGYRAQRTPCRDNAAQRSVHIPSECTTQKIYPLFRAET